MSAKTVKNPPVAPAFTASAELRADLQRALIDITALSLVGKQIHWNVVGPNFRDLHLNLDEVVDISREGSDELAERMRAINAYPDARPSTVAAQTSVPEAPEAGVITSDAVDYIVSAINAVTTTLRDIHDAVDEADPSSSSILEDYTQWLEQQSWFLSAQNSRAGPGRGRRGPVRRAAHQAPGFFPRAAIGRIPVRDRFVPRPRRPPIAWAHVSHRTR